MEKAYCLPRLHFMCGATEPQKVNKAGIEGQVRRLQILCIYPLCPNRFPCIWPFLELGEETGGRSPWHKQESLSHNWNLVLDLGNLGLKESFWSPSRKVFTSGD